MDILWALNCAFRDKLSRWFQLRFQPSPHDYPLSTTIVCNCLYAESVHTWSSNSRN